MATAPEIEESVPAISRESRDDKLILKPTGIWRISTATEAHRVAAEVRPGVEPEAVLELSGLGEMDTVGAWILYQMSERLRNRGIEIAFVGGDQNERELLEVVSANDNPCEVEPPPKNSLIRQIEDIGVGTYNAVAGFGALLSFVGLVMARLFGAVREPKRIRVTPLVHQLEHVGMKSVPIVGLIAFLIGAVIVNQGAVQLRTFGAEIFVVNMVSIAQLRELGILLTAIIVAGRSGSSFTAQIGSMVMHEEVNAIRTLGMSPIDILVIPRLLALVLMLPILTFYADVMGLLGGGLMAWISLDITPNTFITRANDAVTMNTFLVGMIKAPVFAIVIAISGCYQGLTVSGSADSVGRHTTISVVQAIFLVIVLDALFAVFFTAVDM